MLRSRTPTPNPTSLDNQHLNPNMNAAHDLEPDTPMSHHNGRMHAPSGYQDSDPFDKLTAGALLAGSVGMRVTPSVGAGVGGEDSRATSSGLGGGMVSRRMSLPNKEKDMVLDHEEEGEKQKDGLLSSLAGRRGEKIPALGLGNGLGFAGKGKGKGNRLGLSCRAWLALTAVLGLIMLSRLLFTSESRNTHREHHPDHAGLIPRDYLNNSRSDPAPFEFCPVFGPGDAIVARRGHFELLRSRLHMGTGARVQRMLQKAMSGAPITISILGGSVSACMGVGDDPVSERCYPAKFFSWWNTVYPHPANELTNGAVRKTDSAYYAYCNGHHLPDKTDLVILEFDAADPNDPEWLQHFELLVRSVLVRPEMPAVIILGHFSPQVQAQNGFAGPELLHNVAAQFYDVPHISVKGVLYEQYLEAPARARSTFYTDPIHANQEGHDLIADVLISYIMSQTCAGWAALQGYSYDVPALGSEADGTSTAPSLLGGVGLRKGMPGQSPGDGESASSALSDRYQGLRVPPMRMADRPHDMQSFREIEPFCVAASDLINPLPPSLFYGSGWHTYHPPKNAIVEDRHYWYAEQPTARLRIPLRLGAGDVGVYFLQSPVDKPLGVVKCWVDDNFGGGAELHGTAEVEDVIATLQMIDRGVSRGSHFIECQLQGEAGGSSPPFKILGIFTT